LLIWYIFNFFFWNIIVLTESIEKSLVTPIQTFVKKEIRDARYFSHEFLKAQVEYESGIQKLNQLKQKSKLDPKKFHTTNLEFTSTQQKFDQVWFNSFFFFKKKKKNN